MGKTITDQTVESSIASKISITNDRAEVVIELSESDANIMYSDINGISSINMTGKSIEMTADKIATDGLKLIYNQYLITGVYSTDDSVLFTLLLQVPAFKRLDFDDLVKNYEGKVFAATGRCYNGKNSIDGVILSVSLTGYSTYGYHNLDINYVNYQGVQKSFPVQTGSVVSIITYSKPSEV